MVSVLKAIRRFCLACVGGKPSEVRLCSSKDCDLYEFRLGHKRKPIAKEES